MKKLTVGWLIGLAATLSVLGAESSFEASESVEAAARRALINRDLGKLAEKNDFDGMLAYVRSNNVVELATNNVFLAMISAKKGDAQGFARYVEESVRSGMTNDSLKTLVLHNEHLLKSDSNSLALPSKIFSSREQKQAELLRVIKATPRAELVGAIAKLSVTWGKDAPELSWMVRNEALKIGGGVGLFKKEERAVVRQIAVDLYEILGKADPTFAGDPANRLQRVTFAIDGEEFVDAALALDSLRRDEPKWCEGNAGAISYSIGKLYEATGSRDEALKEFRKTMAIDRSHGGFYADLAKSRIGQIEDREEYARTIRDPKPLVATRYWILGSGICFLALLIGRFWRSRASSPAAGF